MKQYQELEEYILNWKSIGGVKPKNEEVFINGFINLLDTLDDDRDITFDGEGSYFGKQITLQKDSGVGILNRKLYFEVAYSNDKISVYDGNNQGFWTPEYILIDKHHNRFFDLKSALINKLNSVFGLL